MSTQIQSIESIRLVAKSPGGAQQRFELPNAQGVFVGRSDNCGVQLRGEDVAEIHCRLQYDDGTLTVQDWMTGGGTRVNGQVIDGAVTLNSSDVLQVGQCEVRIDTSTGKQAATEFQQAAEPPRSEEPEQSAVLQQASIQQPHQDGREAISDVIEATVQAETVEDPISNYDSFDCESPESMVMDVDAFCFDDDEDEEQTYDRETVDLLRAEIEELQTALAQRDAETFAMPEEPVGDVNADESSEQMMQRMQQLIEEANRSDERVALLEEMLHAAEDSNRCEVEERQQLEAWVGDIEVRIGQRESEHVAEIESLKQRLQQAAEQHDKLRRKLAQVASGENAPPQFDETLEALQGENRSLQQRLDETEKQRQALQQQLDEASGMQDRAIREERAKLAQEQARVSRMRFELSRKLGELDEMPAGANDADKETAHRIKTLREHLKEIHEQEQREAKESSLTTRLARLWKKVDY